MPHNGPSINVEHALLKSRNFRRRPGEVPYPLEHVDASCSVFDIWNNMYRSRFENLTLHDFQTPPGMVLDLGCGTGYWAIEAAKKWKNSIVVGFDIKDVQPQLHYTRVLKHHHDIANRVKWVHGNLLDGLPFRSDHFDFVRVVNIGLGVPEDEWQFVFEEITRVMKPGGVIEVIEEDPIFPCAWRPKQIVDHPPPLIIPQKQILSRKSSATILSSPSWEGQYEVNTPISEYISPASNFTRTFSPPPSRKSSVTVLSNPSLYGHRKPSLEGHYEATTPISTYTLPTSSLSQPLLRRKSSAIGFSTSSLEGHYEANTPISTYALPTSSLSQPLPPPSSYPSRKSSAIGFSTSSLEGHYEANTPISAYALPVTLNFTQPFPNAPSYPATNPSLPPNHSRKPSTENEPEESDKNRTPDLRDHSRLKVAWNAMLASRFIAENALTVLPFYLSSTFVDVQSLPPVKVLLPPNSPFNSSERRAVLKRSSTESFFTATTFTSSRKAPPLSRTSSAWSAKSAAPSSLSRTSSGDSLDPYTTEFAQMHLANTVHTVLGCKEAIWQEYKKLYDFNVTKVVSPSAASPSGYTAHSTPRNLKSAIRESFDDEWESWHNDMTDRIGMRNLMSQLNWPEPPGQEPEWHVWRKKVQAIDDKKPNPIIPHNDTLDICRSMRGFIAFKPL